MPVTLHSSWQLRRALPAQPATGIHAALYDLLDAVDPDVAGHLHRAQLSPLSLGLARHRGFGGVLGQDRQTLQLRLHCVHDELGDFLQAALEPGTVIGRSGTRGRGMRVEGRTVGLQVDRTPAHALQGAVPDLTVELLSPTLLRSGEAFLAEPRPDVVLHGLLRRWQAFMPGDRLDRWSLVPSVGGQMLGGQTISVAHPKLPHTTIKAYQGRLRLTFPDAETAAALAPVVRLGAWTGIGIKTMYGFGQLTLT